MWRSWSVMPVGALQDKKSKLAIQLVRGLNSRPSQVTRPSRQPFCFEKLIVRIPNTLQYKYPLYPRNIESFQREYWERNPREKQDWLIHNLHKEALQIPLLSPSLLLHPWENRYQNIFSPYPHLWEGHLVLRKQLGRDQFTLVDAMVYSGIWEAKEDKGSMQPHWSRSLEGLGILGRFSLEGLLLFMYSNYIL